MILAKISDNYTSNGSSYRVVFTERVETALRMLDLSEKTNTEQETSTPYGDFLDKLHTFIDQKDCFLRTKYECFKGISDVIFEYTFEIVPNTRETTTKINSIEVMGTIINEVINYFNWNRYSTSLIDTYNLEKYEYLFR